jgi:hypothetical protein
MRLELDSVASGQKWRLLWSRGASVLVRRQRWLLPVAAAIAIFYILIGRFLILLATLWYSKRKINLNVKI